MHLRFNDSTFRVNHRSCNEHPLGGYCMETVYDDGSFAGACPQRNDPDSQSRAQALGYGMDLWQMTLEHEIAHTFIAEMRDMDHSIILWNVAHGGGKRWPVGGQDEEARVLALMRYQQTGFVDPLLSGFEQTDFFCAFQSLIDMALFVDESVA